MKRYVYTNDADDIVAASSDTIENLLNAKITDCDGIQETTVFDYLIENGWNACQSVVLLDSKLRTVENAHDEFLEACGKRLVATTEIHESYFDGEDVISELPEWFWDTDIGEACRNDIIEEYYETIRYGN